MSTVRYTTDHEWIRLDGEIATVGITDYAQGQLGDVVFVELPEPGRALVAGKEAAVVESVKAASEVYAPLDGVVAEVNPALAETPALVNEDAEGEGWFFRMRLVDAAAVAALLDRPAYEAFLAEAG